PPPPLLHGDPVIHFRVHSPSSVAFLYRGTLARAFGGPFEQPLHHVGLAMAQPADACVALAQRSEYVDAPEDGGAGSSVNAQSPPFLADIADIARAVKQLRGADAGTVSDRRRTTLAEAQAQAQAQPAGAPSRPRRVHGVRGRIALVAR